VFLLAFAGLMGWLLSIALARSLSADSRTSRRELLLLLGCCYLPVILLLGNAAGARSSGAAWAARATAVPLRSLTALEAAGNGEEVLLVGRAQPEQEGSSGDAPAYLVEYDDEGKRWGEHGALRLGLEGGSVPVTGLDAVFHWNWRYQRGSRPRYWLAAEDPVVIVGAIRHSTSLLGVERGRRLVSVEAGLVRQGSHADFVAAADEQSRRLWPRLLAWASLAGALVVSLLPPLRWLQRRATAPLAPQPPVE